MLNQKDGTHPTSEGYGLIAENVWNVLQPMLGKGRGTVSSVP
jgi:lysophospholipase L1-like esterase